MANLGLLLIIVGWTIQFFSKGNNIKANFVVLYSIGVALLAIDGYVNNLSTLAILNFVSLVSALAVYFKIKK